MKISIRRGFSAAPDVVTCEWPELVSWFEAGAKTAYARKEDVPLVLFGATESHRRGVGLTEEITSGWEAGDQNAEGLWCAAFDFDDVQPEGFAAALEHAKTLGAGFAHTTWQHGIVPGVVRARIVLQCAEPIPLDRWPGLWAYLAQSFSRFAAVDAQCKNANRCWYVPSRNPSSALQADGAWFEAWPAPGVVL